MARLRLRCGRSFYVVDSSYGAVLGTLDWVGFDGNGSLVVRFSSDDGGSFELVCCFEWQLYDLETTYLHDSSQCGNVLKGFEGFLSSMKGSGK